jgi:SAM-dependent methyltransferase
MSLPRRFAKAVIPPIVVDVARAIRDRRRSAGAARNTAANPGEAAPWDHGYYERKRSLIVRTLQDDKLLAAFRTGTALPDLFGYGIDERCVEYPWLFSRLGETAQQVVFDAGSALNHDYVLDGGLSEAKLTIMTLAPEQRCYWDRGISYLYGDLRDNPIRSDFYDAVVCISTLEHIGANNSRITARGASRELASGDALDAISEMKRILRPGGRFFLTVPFGCYRHYETFEQYDSARLNTVIEAFAPSAVQKSFFLYDADGWRLAAEGDCAACEYAGWVAEAWLKGETPSPAAVEPDHAAAARAVACIEFVKGD